MANLKDTTVSNISIENQLDVSDTVNSPGVGVYGYKSDGGGSNTETGPINWNGIRQNSNISISNTNSRFTVPEDGFYYVSFRNIGNNVGTTSVTYLNVNGSSAGRVRAYARSAEFNYPMSLAFAVYELKEGDYVEFSKNDAAMYQSATTYTQFAIFKIG